MSDPKWFYARGEERFGPVTSQKLKSLAAAGKLQPADLIWKEDMHDWNHPPLMPRLLSMTKILMNREFMHHR